MVQKQQREVAITWSYDEEKAVVRMALEWLLPLHKAVVICIDSHSLLKTIQSGSADTSDLRRMLCQRAGNTTLHLILGHHRVADNDVADAFANQVTAVAVTP